MTIQINKTSGQRILELGGGSNRNPASDCNVDVRAERGVDFVADFNQPLPIQSDEWDGVLSVYCIEHLSWRSVPLFISEIYRVLKPGGQAIIVTANTEAQIEWIKSNPNGWDGKSAFESFSCVLFGDQDYEANTHRNYLNPTLVTKLFSDAGFENILIQPYGDRNTDMGIQATRPINALAVPTQAEMKTQTIPSVPVQQNQQQAEVVSLMNREEGRSEVFGKAYFNGGGKFGGYAREGYRDFGVHEITARHVLSRKPKSVLEIGAARGYILKRIQDAGIPGWGIEISKHCFMTRACENIFLHDLCKTPWPLKERVFFMGGSEYNTKESVDLSYSIAVFEHIPEQFLPAILNELKRVSKRGLHGIDFGHSDDGFDKSHCTLRPLSFWRSLFDAHGLQSHEIVDKEELEKGDFPADVLRGDGRTKLNLGSYTVQNHHGWINIDVHDLQGWSQANGYHYLKHDLKTGIPYGTGVVDRIVCSHMLEHLTYAEGLSFLRECRRVIRPDGAMRIAVPDAELLMNAYIASMNSAYNLGDGSYTLSDFDEISDGCAAAPTAAGKLWELLHSGHQAAYDYLTLAEQLKAAGWVPHLSEFRKITETNRDAFAQIQRESTDGFVCLSLYIDAVPLIG